MRGAVQILLAVLLLLVGCQGKVIILTDDNFDEQVQEGRWLVAAYYSWCQPCQQLAPVWEKLAEELEGEVYVAKFDAERNRVLPRRFGITGVPSIFYLYEGTTREYPQAPEGKRTFKSILHFAREGWRKYPPVPFYRSPNGAFGRAYGSVLSLPSRAAAGYTYMREQRGWSDLSLLAVVLAVPCAVGLAAICALDAYYTRRPARGAVHVHMHAE